MRDLVGGAVMGVLLGVYFWALSNDRGQRKERAASNVVKGPLRSSAQTGIVAVVYGVGFLVLCCYWAIFKPEVWAWPSSLGGTVVALGGLFFLCLGILKLRRRLIVDSVGLRQTSVFGEKRTVLRWADVSALRFDKDSQSDISGRDLEYCNPPLLVELTAGETHRINLGRFRSRLAVLEVIREAIPRHADVDPLVHEYCEKLGERTRGAVPA